eukprot:m.884356 g.884356  ORF g.884356 m.884356 type:complete len:61 (-) comp23613_c0_seq29:101-283(-)
MFSDTEGSSDSVISVCNAYNAIERSVYYAVMWCIYAASVCNVIEFSSVLVVQLCVMIWKW